METVKGSRTGNRFMIVSFLTSAVEIVARTQGGKTNVITPTLLTGLPFAFRGTNCHCLAAATADALRIGCPQIGYAEMIFPLALSLILTVTIPFARKPGSAGYNGATFLIARLSR